MFLSNAILLPQTTTSVDLDPKDLEEQPRLLTWAVQGALLIGITASLFLQLGLNYTLPGVYLLSQVFIATDLPPTKFPILGKIQKLVYQILFCAILASLGYSIYLHPSFFNITKTVIKMTYTLMMNFLEPLHALSIAQADKDLTQINEKIRTVKPAIKQTQQKALSVLLALKDLSLKNYFKVQDLVADILRFDTIIYITRLKKYETFNPELPTIKNEKIASWFKFFGVPTLLHSEKFYTISRYGAFAILLLGSSPAPQHFFITLIRGVEFMYACTVLGKKQRKAGTIGRNGCQTKNSLENTIKDIHQIEAMKVDMQVQWQKSPLTAPLLPSYYQALESPFYNQPPEFPSPPQKPRGRRKETKGDGASPSV